MRRRRRHRRKEHKMWLATFPAVGLAAGAAPTLIERVGFELTAPGWVALFFLLAFVPTIVVLALRRETRGAWVFASFALLTIGLAVGVLVGFLMFSPSD